MDERIAPVQGMKISVRTRRDVVIVDLERFLATARAAYREQDPRATEEDAAEFVGDVHDAIWLLLDRDGELAPGEPRTRAEQPSRDRPDGLLLAGEVQHISLDDPLPLPGSHCFELDDPEDYFALPPER
ncbi:hypothetical protein FXF51_25680 [Nonomuraea sp. PA05]|uniref:hypothetical protein n=1 Tax=Nonomuraea sp. PA05 TaxID=2604466 RepID=UPI0011D9D9AA|nr:hypothetical protein [Nonomuraea sp. PA05]TYB62808.1 hypothetical protein FXF51_25680 [Nonomuraea sp. PA05]